MTNTVALMLVVQNDGNTKLKNEKIMKKKLKTMENMGHCNLVFSLANLKDS